LGEFVPGYEASACYGSRTAEETTRRYHRAAEQEANAGLADAKLNVPAADLGAT